MIQSFISRARLSLLNTHLRRAYATKMNTEYNYKIEKKEDRSIVLHPLKEHKYSLVWLHGLGDSAYGFVDIFLDPTLNPAPANCKVLLLTAPERAVTLNQGAVMNSWYDISDLRSRTKTVEELFSYYNQDELMESVGIVSKVVDEEAEKLGGDSKKIFIGGFS